MNKYHMCAAYVFHEINENAGGKLKFIIVNKTLTMLSVCLAFTFTALFGQEVKLTKVQRQDRNLAAQFTKKQIVDGDTIEILRAPLSQIKSSEKFFIDALQKRLEEVRGRVTISSSLIASHELAGIRRLISNIEESDKNWPTSAYNTELALYEKRCKKTAQADSLNPVQNREGLNSQSQSKEETFKNIQTGPRGGQYYINKNGKKTYVKRK